VDVNATFCFERCDRGPTVAINDTVVERCTLQKALDVLESELAKAGATEAGVSS